MLLHLLSLYYAELLKMIFDVIYKYLAASTLSSDDASCAHFVFTDCHDLA